MKDLINIMIGQFAKYIIELAINKGFLSIEYDNSYNSNPYIELDEIGFINYINKEW